MPGFYFYSVYIDLYLYLNIHIGVLVWLERPGTLGLFLHQILLYEHETATATKQILPSDVFNAPKVIEKCDQNTLASCQNNKRCSPNFLFLHFNDPRRQNYSDAGFCCMRSPLWAESESGVSARLFCTPHACTVFLSPAMLLSCQLFILKTYLQNYVNVRKMHLRCASWCVLSVGLSPLVNSGPFPFPFRCFPLLFSPPSAPAAFPVRRSFVSPSPLSLSWHNPSS